MNIKRHFSFFCLLIMVSSGCASSDRMIRMSGGIIGDYTIPASYRIRSEKYQVISKHTNVSEKSAKVEVAGIDDSLINLWPFFFRSSQYWCALWPLIDKDPYGFAFRPFYNHEGDYYSILFPLSAWNMENNTGWAANFYWKKFSDSISTYSMFPVFSCRRSHENFNFQSLLYSQEKIVNKLDSAEYQWLFEFEYGTSESKKCWAYYFRDQNMPYPADEMNFEKFKKEFSEKNSSLEIAKTYTLLPLYKMLYFFPDLFALDHTVKILQNNGVPVSEDGETQCFKISVQGIFDYYKRCNYDFMSSFTGKPLHEQNLFALPVIYGKTEHFDKHETLDRLILLYNEYSRKNGALNRNIFVQQVQKIIPDLKVPETVVDSETQKMFLKDTCRTFTDVPVYTTRYGGVLPLYAYYSGKNYVWQCIPALQTAWGGSPDMAEYKDDSFFFSLPLLTLITENSVRKNMWIFWPVGYRSKEEKIKEPNRYTNIFSRDLEKVNPYNFVQKRSQYTLLGAYYHGHGGFYVVKDRDQYADIIRLRTGMNTLIALQEEIESRQKTLQQTASSVLNKTEADFKGDRLAYLRNEIRREEQNIRQKKLEAEQEKFKKEKLALKHAAERLGFDLNEDALGNADKTDEEIRRLIDRFAELRWQEDYGSFFYRKERYYNGNYRWHFMWFLAGGEKANSRETFQILHLLYRYRQDGDRTERIIFPFISNVTDGKNSRFTFMWRIFNIKKQEGKVSGHIFFIPFHLP